MTWSQALWALFAILGVQAITDLSILVLGHRQAALLRFLPYLVSGAAGVLLATACLDLLPGAVIAGGGPKVWPVLLITLLTLFCIEAVAHGWPGNTPSRSVTEQRRGPTAGDGAPARARRSSPASLLVGSTLHSAVDGVAIAAAFAAGRRTGLSAAVAVALHEMPHRIGDFSLLLRQGLSRQRAAELAIGAGAAAVVGGLALLVFGEHASGAAWLLPVSAGSFLYIALADLVPELHVHSGEHGPGVGAKIACLLGGAALIGIMTFFTGE